MRFHSQKSKISKYVFVLIFTLITFTSGWIVTATEFSDNLSYAITGIAVLVAFSLIALMVLFFSIQSLVSSFRSRYERGAWKGISYFTRIFMLLICACVTFFWIYWTCETLVSGLKDTADWVYSMAYTTVVNISVSGISHTFYVLSFIGICCWALLGISFEVMSKMFVSYKYSVVY